MKEDSPEVVEENKPAQEEEKLPNYGDELKTSEELVISEAENEIVDSHETNNKITLNLQQNDDEDESLVSPMQVPELKELPS